ncbi:MAG: IucA/IucC family siderophore biosynthesis protein [Solirubrobacteraceae bacterium]
MSRPSDPVRPSPPLRADRTGWSAAGPPLLARLLGELAYEGALQPEPDAVADRWRLTLPAATYRFTARRTAFAGWQVDGATVRRHVDDTTTVPEPTTLLLDAAERLDLTGGALVDALRELDATRVADAVLASRRPDAATLADLDHVALEAHGEGHPGMVLNKGRLGFGPVALRHFAPEHAPDVRLVWIAVAPELARHHDAGDDPARAATVLRERQLDEDERDTFAARLRAACGPGEDPSAWAWSPVHPFHLESAWASLCAAELGSGRIVVLGTGRDRHRPLQSVRTLANVDRPERSDVKLPLAIRNTLVWRGLSPAHCAQAGRISAWLAGVTARDPWLERTGFVVLEETDAVTHVAPRLTRIPAVPYRWAEATGAVFRRPVAGVLRHGERARSLASLTLVGRDGRALVTELVARSGGDAPRWLARLLDALLPPLLHWLVRYGVAFCPHGENTVVLFGPDEVPVRVAVKDLAEDVNLEPDARPEGLAPEAAAVLLRWPLAELRHSVLSALVAGHFRAFAPLVAAHLDVPEATFWSLVAGTMARVRRDVGPAQHARFDALGLFDARFERIQLNLEQLSGDAFHERAERDEGFDLAEGTVPNPLATVDRAAAIRLLDGLLDGAPAGHAAAADRREAPVRVAG